MAKFKYNDIEYDSIQECLQEIRKVTGKFVKIPSTDEEVLSLGIEFIKTPDKTDEELAEEVRIKRNDLLVRSDFCVSIPDYPMSEETRQEVYEYRQKLRDIPEQEGFPRTVEWPETPENLL